MAQEISKEKTPRKPRTRSGCITCRIRRVKCDETKPHCTRCLQSGRTCDGYTAVSSAISRRTLATAVRQLQVIGPASRALTGTGSAQDASCFEFFRQKTAHASGSPTFFSEFWSGQLLQAAHTEPAVWRVAVALGALHRRAECSAARTRRPRSGATTPLGSIVGSSSPGSSTEDSTPSPPAAAAAVQSICSTPPPFTASDDPTAEMARLMQHAAAQYGEALSMAREIRDPNTLLALSLAFSAACNMAGMWYDGQVHHRSALNLLDQLWAEAVARGSRGDLSPEQRAMARSLSRLDFQAMTFSDTRAPYIHDRTEARLAQRLLAPRQPLEGLIEAADVMFELLRRFFMLSYLREDGQITEEAFRVRLADEMADLDAWEDEFRVLLGRLGADSPAGLAARASADQRSILSLEVYLATLRAVQEGVDAFAYEMLWDACLDRFVRVVELGEQLIRLGCAVSRHTFCMSLEPGYVMALFIVVARCRHPLVRRRGLALLRSLRRQEGVWSSAGAAVVAEQVVLAEEEGLGIDLPLYGSRKGSGDPVGWEGWPTVPPEQRVISNNVVVDVAAQQIAINLLFATGHEVDPVRIKHVVVTFE